MFRSFTLRPKYSLLSLVISITIVSLWFAYGSHKSRRESRLAKSMDQVGGYVTFDRSTDDSRTGIAMFWEFLCHNHYPRIDAVSFNYKDADNILPHILRAHHLHRVVVVAIDDYKITDEQKAVADRVSTLRPDVDVTFDLIIPMSLLVR